MKRTISLSWKILCESPHLTRKNTLVFSSLLRTQPGNFNFLQILVITLSSSIVHKIVRLFISFVYFGLTGCLKKIDV